MPPEGHKAFLYMLVKPTLDAMFKYLGASAGRPACLHRIAEQTEAAKAEAD